MLETLKDRSTDKVTIDDMETIDNQQETYKDSRGYLGAILDGEGYVSIHVNQHKTSSRGNPRPQITPRISIGNTSSGLIEKCVRIINDLGVGCLVKNRILPSGKKFQTIHVVGMKRVGKLLPEVMGHLAEEHKAKNAKLILEFIRSRMSKEQNVTYTPYELALADSCKHGSSTTTRETLAA